MIADDKPYVIFVSARWTLDMPETYLTLGIKETMYYIIIVFDSCACVYIFLYACVCGWLRLKRKLSKTFGPLGIENVIVGRIILSREEYTAHKNDSSN